MRESSYIIVGTNDEFVYIADCDGPLSVTNDAEAVVAKLIPLFYGKRIMYRDSMGQWDELMHNGKVFTGFATGHEPTGLLY